MGNITTPADLIISIDEIMGLIEDAFEDGDFVCKGNSIKITIDVHGFLPVQLSEIRDLYLCNGWRDVSTHWSDEKNGLIVILTR